MRRMAVDRRRPRRAPAAIASLLPLLLLLVALLLVEAVSAAPAPSQATTKPATILTKTTRAIKINGADVNLADVEAGRARLPPGVRVTSGAAARQAALASVGSKALLPPVPPVCLTELEAIAFPPIATTGTNAALQLNYRQTFDSSLSPVCSTPLQLASYLEYAIENTLSSVETFGIVNPIPPGESSVSLFTFQLIGSPLLGVPFAPSSRPLVAGAVSSILLNATNNATNNALVSYYSSAAAWSFILNGTAGVRSAAPLLNCTSAVSAGALSVSAPAGKAGKHDKQNDGISGVPLTAALNCSGGAIDKKKGGGGSVIKVTGATVLKSAPLVCANKTFFAFGFNGEPDGDKTAPVLFAPQYPQGLFGLPVLGCVADVTALAAAACDGRTTCVITTATLAAAGFNATTCPPAAFVGTGSQLTAGASYTCVEPHHHNKKDDKHNDYKNNDKRNDNNNKGRKLKLDAAALP